ncbi:DUF4328 domain-containing protein [Streptomyces sp. NPDC014889]|uniref:DUF4328 domain-containing protein n=1 Tax=Streptomyces sp. NPDC014889 TaxID=3364928 RepID=UPI0036FB36C5
MICARCRHFAVVPGGTLCAGCSAASASAAPPYPGVPSLRLRSPVGLGRAAVAMLLLVVAGDLFAIGADVFMYDVSGDLMNGSVGGDVMRRADDADRLYAVAGVVQVLTLLASCVVFLCWFHRVRVNADVFDPSAHSKSRGWAIGAWFTPVVNLWYPRRITADIWDASSPADRSGSHRLVDVWWALWLIGLLVDRVAATAYNRADTAEELHRAGGQMMLSDALDIVAAVLAVLVVLRLTRMQHEKALRGPAPATA